MSGERRRYWSRGKHSAKWQRGRWTEIISRPSSVKNLFQIRAMQSHADERRRYVFPLARDYRIMGVATRCMPERLIMRDDDIALQSAYNVRQQWVKII